MLLNAWLNQLKFINCQRKRNRTSIRFWPIWVFPHSTTVSSQLMMYILMKWNLRFYYCPLDYFPSWWMYFVMLFNSVNLLKDALKYSPHYNDYFYHRWELGLRTFRFLRNFHNDPIWLTVDEKHVLDVPKHFDRII